MRPFRDEAELADALRELRPEPWPEFAAKLDARAAAGFPRDSRRRAPEAEPEPEPLARLRVWLGVGLASIPARRLIAPAGAFAVVAILVATAVVATKGSEEP